MTTSLQTDPRRASRDGFRKPGRPPLELPILFQLADLSVQPPRPTPLPSVAAPILPPPPVVEVVALPAAPREAAPLEEPPHLDVPRIEILNPEPVVVETPKVKLPEAAALQVESPPAAVEIENKDTENKSAVEDGPVTQPAAGGTRSVPATIQASATDIAPPREATAPTPRAPTEQRWKGRQAAPAHGDWMRTHGKFIAVGFVIALIATIYMAQNGDEPAPASPNPAASATAEAEAKQVAGEATSGSTDEHAAKEPVPVVEHPRLDAASEASPAAGVADHPHAELHPPVGHSAIQEPVDNSEMVDAKSLFPWKDAEQTRVASKPNDGRAKADSAKSPPETETTPRTEPALSEPALSEPAPADTGAEEAPSIYGPPSSLNREPSAQPGKEGPQLQAPAAYPVTNQSSYRANEPPQARPNAGQRATPASFDKAPQPRTSGPRHERTGSGLY